MLHETPISWSIVLTIHQLYKKRWNNPPLFILSQVKQKSSIQNLNDFRDDFA